MEEEKMITFKRVSNELIEGSTKFWNEETMKHEAIWTIKTAPKFNIVFSYGMAECEAFVTIKEAKQYIINEELKKGLPLGEIEEGFRDGGGWSGGYCITGDGNGFAWHKDGNGNIIRD